ncbi:kinase-like domain-containing protein [Aspergillus unguis]
MAIIESALELIAAADLSPTEHLLLKHFVEAAIDPNKAAEYVVSRVQASDQNIEQSLRQIKDEFRKLASRITVRDSMPCHLQDMAFKRDGRDFVMSYYPSHVPGSQSEPAYIIPPSMMQGLEFVEKGSLMALLEAFLSHDSVTQLSELLSDSERTSQLLNVLLLPPTVHDAFRHGHVDIRTRAEMAGRSLPGEGVPGKCVYGVRRLYPEEPDGLYLGDGTPFNRIIQYFQLSTPDPKALPLPSTFLLNIHFRFATALHLFSIEDKASRGWPSPPIGLSIPTAVRSCFSWVWLSLPLGLRVPCYMFLNRIGRWLYPREADIWAQRLPFGLYMKQCNRAPENEPNVLRLIEKHTNIPAPRLVDIFKMNGVTNIIMTRLPGVPVDEVYHLMSYPEREQFAKDLMACVQQLRKLPNKTPYTICNSLGGPITDHRLPDGIAGPFNTEADFNNCLASDLDCSFARIVEVKNLAVREHKHFPFTHSDLHPTNLLVERARLSGIVDWESAGFKPEYWEFTKCFYGIGAKSDINDLYWQTFGREYESELEVEKQLWYLTPF